MRLVIAVLGLAGLATACAGEDHVDDEVVNCDLETRDDDFVIGLEKIGNAQALSFKLMSSTPAPPIRGDNTWVIQINAMAGGTAVDGASLLVTPFMPDHGHPAGKTVEIEAMPEAGQYQLSPLNFWMPGLWETTVEVTSSGGDDVVVFKFCVPA
jgi:hypothetical protein